MTWDEEETTPLKLDLFESVRQRLADNDFELNLGRHKFFRRIGGFVHHFQLVCKKGDRGYRVQPNVGVRVELVERIFHQTSGFESQYQENTSTMGAPVGILLNGTARACEFKIESSVDVASVTNKIVTVFDQAAVPYYERWSSLSAIDAELNSTPGSPTLHRSLAWFRCSTAVIVARLIDRDNYEQLVAFYTDAMMRDNKGFYLGRFKDLLASLEVVPPGAGN